MKPLAEIGDALMLHAGEALGFSKGNMPRPRHIFFRSRLTYRAIPPRDELRRAAHVRSVSKDDGPL
jgi:hypothetical protein